MKLSGNRVIQQKAVEKNMKWHYLKLRNPTQPNPDFCRWTNDKPKPVPSKAQPSKSQAAKKHIRQENERLMTRLYEILSDGRRPQSPKKKKDGKKDVVAEAREIRAKAKLAKNEIEMKRIDEENQKLLTNITTMRPILDLKEKEQEYLAMKRVADDLRRNTSHTALHLLASPGVLEDSKKSKSPTRPKSAGSLPSWYKRSGQKIHPYSDKQPRKTPPPDRASYVAGNPYPKTPHHKASASRSKEKRNMRPSSASATSRGKSNNTSSRKKSSDEFDMLSEREVRDYLYGDDSAKHNDHHHHHKYKKEEDVTSPGFAVGDSVESTGEGGDFIDGFADKSVTDLAPPPEPLAMEPIEIDETENTKEQYVPPSTPKSRKLVLMETEMPGNVIGADAHLPAAHLNQSRASFMVRLFDVGMICSASYFNNSSLKPSSELVATSSGVLVESRSFPETEKSIAHELFLPIKQLKILADKSPAPGADSLCRKLRRLRCLDRERGLFASLSSELDGAGQELLSELILKNIETVITITGENRRKKKAPRKSTDDSDEDDVDKGEEGGDRYNEDNHKGTVELRLK